MMIRLVENTDDRKEYVIDLGHLLVHCWWLKVERRQGGYMERKSNGEIVDRFSFATVMDMYRYIDSYCEL